MKKSSLLLLLLFLFSYVPICNGSNKLTDEIKGDLKKYMNEIPAIGMIADKVDYEGITLSDFKFLNGKKYVFCSPKEEVTALVNYAIDHDQLESLHLHHFIYGLYPDGPQGCLVRSFGFVDREGSTSFTIKAPCNKGVYEVRFSHGEGLTFETASEEWWKQGNPPSNTIMGVLIVE